MQSVIVIRAVAGAAGLRGSMAGSLYRTGALRQFSTRTIPLRNASALRVQFCRKIMDVRYISQSLAPSPANDAHKKAIEQISGDVRRFYERKEKFRINHGSTNSTRNNAKGKNIINIGGLSHVLEVNTATQTALVEPNVPMDRLVEETLKHGLVPPVVMEFPGITVGGGYAGTSGESSSFRHGFFNRTIKRVEMILADGQVVTCSETERPDLFHGAAGAIEELTQDPSIDYVDGIIHAWDPWFYMHVDSHTQSRSSTPPRFAIPLAEYLFRYDRGGFWVGASAFKYFSTPFNKFTRWFLDDFLHTRMMYTALHAAGMPPNYIVQDLALPYSTATQFVDYTDSYFGIYPLWLCPLKQSPLPTMHPYNEEYEADGKTLKPLLNIGLWGYGKQHDLVTANVSLERKLKELGGMKWLYAQTYYSENEFWEMYDRKWYDGLREKYGATSLPSVYEKVKAAPKTEEEGLSLLRKTLKIWPVSGFYGIWKAIQSKSYLAARASTWKDFDRMVKEKEA
ncbi:24-dehydrocholesterol reductase precursor protein [Rutstroemia sp. NJR-2017a BBW]|nr:24-dehydrocholesterol reductase precursor protein [Rutstroemia sp. NJR-2017a BBW]